MLTIAWDVDDVLNNLTKQWLCDYCEKQNIKIAYKNIVSNPPHNILNITFDEYINSLDSFRLSNKALNMLPNNKIINWFEQYGYLFNNIVITSTAARTSQNSAFWVMKHFHKWIHSFNIVPSYRVNDNVVRNDKTKKEFLERERNVDIFIDDNEKNIEDAKELGIKTFLVAQPWNSNGLKIEKILIELTKIGKNNK